MSEKHKLFELEIRQAADALYASLDANERRLVQFGMLPAVKAREVEAKLVASYIQAEGHPPDPRKLCEITRLLSVGVMDAANRGPDKMVV